MSLKDTATPEFYAFRTRSCIKRRAIEALHWNNNRPVIVAWGDKPSNATIYPDGPVPALRHQPQREAPNKEWLKEFTALQQELKDFEEYAATVYARIESRMASLYKQAPMVSIERWEQLGFVITDDGAVMTATELAQQEGFDDEVPF